MNNAAYYGHKEVVEILIKQKLKERSESKSESSQPSPSSKIQSKPASEVSQQGKDPMTNDEFIIDLEEERNTYENAGKIGEGATSITYKLINKRTKKPLCKKVIKYKNGEATFKDAQRALSEFEVMHHMTHPCICKAFFINPSEPVDESNEEITTISIFLEYLDYSLGELLKTKTLNNTKKAKVVLEIVHAMNYLHKHGMMHRDLKIENIMLDSLFNTKLVDFGLVRITEVDL